MIGMQTRLDVADNSGARKLQTILPRGGSVGSKAGLGDVVTASVKEAAPNGNVKKGQVVRAVIVRMRKESRRNDGTYIRFDQNAADSRIGRGVPEPPLGQLDGLRHPMLVR